MHFRLGPMEGSTQPSTSMTPTTGYEPKYHAPGPPAGLTADQALDWYLAQHAAQSAQQSANPQQPLGMPALPPAPQLALPGPPQGLHGLPPGLQLSLPPPPPQQHLQPSQPGHRCAKAPVQRPRLYLRVPDDPGPKKDNGAAKQLAKVQVAPKVHCTTQPSSPCDIHHPQACDDKHAPAADWVTEFYDVKQLDGMCRALAIYISSTAMIWAT